ncbi:hypothetical protein PGTUg99_011267 [Puccinia graminis f. sp. tritici]|uniref:Uncharacterized protein n=1 Tax=Puccinia graminis f. sp. tritici TaxID=56615 RepID=A0A5B0MSB6_PUCGR|nr:hypothetical protein PGTUg99_011267 [Puccinia graminis f. sp. tritici]
MKLALERGELQSESLAKRQACEKEYDVNDIMNVNDDDRQPSSSSSDNRNASITLINRISSSSIDSTNK